MTDLLNTFEQGMTKATQVQQSLLVMRHLHEATDAGEFSDLATGVGAFADLLSTTLMDALELLHTVQQAVAKSQGQA